MNWRQLLWIAIALSPSHHHQWASELLLCSAAEADSPSTGQEPLQQDATLSSLLDDNEDDAGLRVFGGSPVENEANRYPYIKVSIQYDEDYFFDQHMCGGSVIAKDIVLTAAHCAMNSSLLGDIHIGRYDFSDATEVYEEFTADQLIIHPGWNISTTRYDLALIVLSDPVSSDVIPVRLNADSSLPFPGDPLSVFGWGATNMTDDFFFGGQPTYPDEINVGLVRALTNDKCESMATEWGEYPYLGAIYPDMLCAGRQGVDACFGDSGGPLIIDNGSASADVQVGVVSWGAGCALLPGIYASVSYNYDWLRTQVCEFSRSPPEYLNCGGETEPAPTSLPLEDTPSPAPSQMMNSPSPTSVDSSSPTSVDFTTAGNNSNTGVEFPWSGTYDTDHEEDAVNESDNSNEGDDTPVSSSNALRCNLFSFHALVIIALGGIEISYMF